MLAIRCDIRWNAARGPTRSGRGATNYSVKITGDDGDYLFGALEEFVVRSVAASRPFLSAVWTHYIHLPHPAMPADFEAAVPSGDPDYIGALEMWDRFMGKVQGLLKDNGVFENTLVWVSSDNGPHCKESPAVCYGPIGHGRSNGGVRGCKASVFEGGIRVPGIIQFPAEITEHRDIDVPAVTHDILPTVMDLLGVAHPHPTWPLDGISLRPHFKAATAPARRSKPIGFWWGSEQAWIDNDLKLIAGTGEIGVGQGCTHLPPWTAGLNAPALFNLSASPTESVNLVNATGYAGTLETMTAAFDAWTVSVSESVATESRCGKKPAPAPAPPGPAPPPGNCTFTFGLIGFGVDGWDRATANKELCCGMCVADPSCTVAIYLDGYCRGHSPETKPGRQSAKGWACRARTVANSTRA